MRQILCVAGALLALSATQALAQSEARLALVIGNAAYAAPEIALKNPVNDARAIAATLKDLGFSVSLLENADHATMRRAIREYEDELRQRNGVSLFYFAGHGVQLEGHNYLVPVAANLEIVSDARERAVDANELLERFRTAGSRLSIVILDACRDNPLRKPGLVLRGGKPTVGLASMQPASGALIAFATEPDRVATDAGDPLGVYAKYLTRYMRMPGLPLEQVFKRVREAVIQETNGAQVPVEFSTLTGGDFYFVPPGSR